MKIKKGDKVTIIAGKDRSKSGSVLSIITKTNKIIVDGLNLITRHVKPKKSGEKGQKIKVPAPLSISNVSLICPKCKKNTRIGYMVTEKGKSRVCKKCKASID
jgi:large subunit ribosomal protein L24